MCFLAWFRSCSFLTLISGKERYYVNVHSLYCHYDWSAALRAGQLVHTEEAGHQQGSMVGLLQHELRSFFESEFTVQQRGLLSGYETHDCGLSGRH